MMRGMFLIIPGKKINSTLRDFWQRYLYLRVSHEEPPEEFTFLLRLGCTMNMIYQ